MVWDSGRDGKEFVILLCILYKEKKERVMCELTSLSHLNVYGTERDTDVIYNIFK